MKNGWAVGPSPPFTSSFLSYSFLILSYSFINSFIVSFPLLSTSLLTTARYFLEKFNFTLKNIIFLLFGLELCYTLVLDY